MRSSRSTCRGWPRRGARGAGSGASGGRVRPAPSARVALRGRPTVPRVRRADSRGLGPCRCCCAVGPCCLDFPAKQKRPPKCSESGAWPLMQHAPRPPAPWPPTLGTARACLSVAWPAWVAWPARLSRRRVARSHPLCASRVVSAQRAHAVPTPRTARYPSALTQCAMAALCRPRCFPRLAQPNPLCTTRRIATHVFVMTSWRVEGRK